MRGGGGLLLWKYNVNLFPVMLNMLYAYVFVRCF